MGQRISGQGVGLQPPQYLYPSELNPSNTPLDLGNAYADLAPGDSLPVPAGSWYIDPGKAGVIQFSDPVTGVWRLTGAAKAGPQYVVSDGFNYRVANLTGTSPVAVVTNGGSNYVQSTTTVTSSSGGSTWRAIVGGMLSVSTIAEAGSGYGVPPLVLIEAPPSGGVQATANAVITGGSVTTVTLSNVGAGYVNAPSAVIVPSPADPNLANGTIVAAEVTLAVVGDGEVAAVVCTNPGASIASAPTLTISGAGASATATALRLSTFTGGSALNGSGFTGGGVLTTAPAIAPAVPAYVNPEIQGLNFVGRSANVGLSGAGGSLTSVAAVYDGGLMLGTPVVAVGGAPVGVYAGGTLTFAGAPTTVLMQPAP